MMTKILIAEDEKPLRQSLKYLLEIEGFEVLEAGSGDKALAVFKNNRPDAILLDLMLPVISGEEIARTIRKTSNVPIIMVTAKADGQSKISGLNMGADDYITKPFDSTELIARLKAVLRRTKKDPSSLTLGPFKYNPGEHMIFYNDQKVDLPLKEYKIMECLILNKGKVTTRQQLFNEAWDDFFGTEKTLDVHIRRLRQRFGDCIKTVRGVGYKIDINKTEEANYADEKI